MQLFLAMAMVEGSDDRCRFEKKDSWGYLEAEGIREMKSKGGEEEEKRRRGEEGRREGVLTI